MVAAMIPRALALAVLLVLSAGASRAEEAAGADEAAVRQLNSDYVRAYLACDVARFKALLADDFSGVLADGHVIDKAEFLRLAKDNLEAHDLRMHDVVVRSFGDAVLVGAVVTYTRANGVAVRTRYSSLYARRAGQWVIVWTQWTRVLVP